MSDLRDLFPKYLVPATDERRCYHCAWWHRAKLDWEVGECGKHRAQTGFEGQSFKRGPSLRLIVSVPRWYNCPSFEVRGQALRPSL